MNEEKQIQFIVDETPRLTRVGNEANSKESAEILDIAYQIGAEACGCVTLVRNNIELPINDIRRFSNVRRIFPVESIHYEPTANSVIRDPGQFLRRVALIEESVFAPSERPKIEENAGVLKEFVESTIRIKGLQAQSDGAPFGKKSGIKDVKKFKEYKLDEIDRLEKTRRENYKIKFGFGNLIRLGVITDEQFEEIFQADIRNLSILLKENEFTYLTNRQKIDKYKKMVDQYVKEHKSNT